MAQKEPDLETHVIPENFVDTGRCFNGMFRTRNLIEGVVLALPIGYITTHLELTMEQTIVVTTICAGTVLMLCLNGINDGSLLEFLAHAWSFGKKKRISRYNPRIKTEARPEYLINTKTELPRDKMMKIMHQFRTTEEDIAGDIYNPMNKEFFEDDFGQLETPEQLKTPRERMHDKKMARIRKRSEKKENKKKAKEEKMLAKAMREQEKAEKKKPHIVGPR